jgi:hypothetical protein
VNRIHTVVSAWLAEEAIAAGVPVAVCSTSNERAVSTIVRVMLGPAVAERMRVFAGDMVPKKKPDPAIYLMAARELGVDPARCVVTRRCDHVGKPIIAAPLQNCPEFQDLVAGISGWHNWQFGWGLGMRGTPQ